jgi:hypothetical protein
VRARARAVWHRKRELFLSARIWKGASKNNNTTKKAALGYTPENACKAPLSCVCVSCGQKQKCSIARARPRYILEAVKIRSLLIHRPALGASRKWYMYIVCDMRRFNQHMFVQSWGKYKGSPAPSNEVFPGRTYGAVGVECNSHIHTSVNCWFIPRQWQNNSTSNMHYFAARDEWQLVFA